MKKSGYVILIILLQILLVWSKTSKNQINPSDLPNYTGAAFESYNGYINFDTKTGTLIHFNIFQPDAHLFYWFFPAKQNKENAPVVLWLNGGPGCASLIGMMLESGPFKFTVVNNQIKINENPFGFNNHANILFFDNPTGAGFSYSNAPFRSVTAVDAAKDMAASLKIFFRELFPEYKNNEFYAFGESYGGKYVISLATELSKDPTINLKGIALGNSWVVPDIQQRVYSKMGYTTGLANYRNYIELNQVDEKCHRLILNNSYHEAQNDQCTPLWLKLIGKAGGFNAYDIRRFGDYEFLDYLIQYFNSDHFKKEAKVYSSGRKEAYYQQCSSVLFKKFGETDFQKSYMNYVPDVLKKYKMLVFSGQFDLRCCVVGTSEWLRVIPWEGRANFNFQKFVPFTVNGVTKGLYKTYSNLTQMVVYGAGHLVPFDQPEAAYNMMVRFTSGKPYNETCQSEPCSPAECPFKCTNHGKCSNGICTCNPGFSGSDCSIYTGTLTFGNSQRHFGLLFGKQPHVYNFDLASSSLSVSGLIDFHVNLRKISNYGKIHIYIGGGDKYITPDETSVDTLLAQFPFHNLEDTFYKQLFVNEIASYQKLTMMIINGVDTEATYEVQYSGKASGLPYDYVLILLSTILISTITVAVILGFYVTVKVAQTNALNRQVTTLRGSEE
eukprot:gene1490-12107_t